MEAKESSDSNKKICPACGKQICSDKRSGSITSYLFGADICTCPAGGKLEVASQNSFQNQFEEESNFCPKCGLQIVSDSHDGSLTGYLFQSTRCKCLPDQAFADGNMTARFWRLKESGDSHIFKSSSASSNVPAGRSIDLVPGAVIGGIYKIIRLLGRGGMGEVYLASHESLNKECALKVIPPEQVTENSWRRFQLEAKAIAKLNHANLVRVTDLGIHEGCLPFYAMDYVEGQNLGELLSEQGPLPLQKVLEIFSQVCDGVDCAHLHGILHRDLKPSNIMLVHTNTDKIQVKILDFGLAKLTGHARTQQSLTAVGDLLGSPFYMSPEQCNGEKLDNRSDIYSLGCAMFECLTGRPPFAGSMPQATIYAHTHKDPPTLDQIVGPEKFPVAMEVIIAKLLRKNPAERYQNLSQLKSDLQRVMAGQDVLPLYVDRDHGLQEAVGRISEQNGVKQETGKKLRISLFVSLAVLVAGALYCVVSLHPAQTIKDMLAKTPSSPAIFSPSSFYKPDHTGAPVIQSATDGRTASSGSLPAEVDPSVRQGEDLHDLLSNDMEDFSDDLKIATSRLFRYRDSPDNAGLHFHQNGEKPGFLFPTDFVIGFISIGEKSPVLAAGFVPAPEGKPVTLYLNSVSRYWSGLLEKFGPSDLTSLEIVTRDFSRAIRILAGWKRLEQLAFFNSLSKSLMGMEKFDDSPITDKDLPLIDSLTRLKSLGLCGSGISGQAVLKMRLMDTLHTIRLKDISQIAPLLEALPTKDNLKEVWLIGQNTTDDQLDHLVAMKNLETLWIRRSKLTPTSLQYFKRMKMLQHLHLDTDWSAQVKELFKKELAGCEFEPSVEKRFWQVLPNKKY